MWELFEKRDRKKWRMTVKRLLKCYSKLVTITSDNLVQSPDSICNKYMTFLLLLMTIRGIRHSINYRKIVRKVLKII